MKFKIGDTVEYIGIESILKNKTGVVIEVDPEDIKYQYYVKINNDVIWMSEEDMDFIGSYKKDLIRNLINEYLSDNETSIREELFLRGFQDYCLEKLGDD